MSIINLTTKNLKNKNIFISGVGKGLGRDMMFKCVDSGAFVFGFTRSKKDIKNLQEKYVKKTKIFIGNATNEKFIKKIFKYFLKKKIVLDGLINNAGERQRKAFINFKSKDIKHIMNVNFISTFLITQQFVHQLNKNSFGSIINIGSIVGENAFSDLVGYASSKSAISGFTKSLSLELSTKGYKTRVNCINPGFTKTSYFKKFSKNKKLYSWTIKKIAAKRWGDPAEISKLAIFLLSNRSSYINGQTINIDGGWKP